MDERIYWLYKPNHSKIGKELLSKHANATGIWNIMPENKNPHPAPFPLDIPTRIIYSIFDEDKDTNQGVINACLCLLAYCTTQSEFNDLLDNEGLIPLGD